MNDEISLDLSNDDQIEKIATALSSKARRKMIKLSTEGSYSVMQLAEFLNMPISTVSFHLKFLKDAGLISILPSPTKRGNEKVVSQRLSSVHLNFKIFHKQKMNLQSIEIPIGSYTGFDITPPCALADSAGIMIGWDQKEAFYSPKRFNAQILSFTKGYVEYQIPLYQAARKKITGLALSLELCSECPMYNNNWKSDVTFWINGIEICTYHSLGDYGDRPGKNTPEFWPANASQYGMLKKIRIGNSGTFIDEEKASDVTINDCKLNDTTVTIRIGIKENAKYVGGVNIFGKHFGDTDQDILLEVSYIDSEQ